MLAPEEPIIQKAEQAAPRDKRNLFQDFKRISHEPMQPLSL